MHSRFVLECWGRPDVTIDGVIPVFTGLFRQHGLPERIRTDNGTPFASNALGRLSRLSVWFIQVGILPELIEPGCPQQNGKHENMHLVLKSVPPDLRAPTCGPSSKRFEDSGSSTTKSGLTRRWTVPCPPISTDPHLDPSRSNLIRSRIRATSRHASSARTEGSAGTGTVCPSAGSSLAMKSDWKRLTTVSLRSTSDPSG